MFDPFLIDLLRREQEQRHERPQLHIEAPPVSDPPAAERPADEGPAEKDERGIAEIDFTV